MLYFYFSLVLSLFLQTCRCYSSDSQATFAAAVPHSQKPDYVKVPVTLGVMSRCPDAIFCENVFDTVLSLVGEATVDVDLAFIAKLNASEPKYGVTCKHGDQECAGNVHELCVSHHQRHLSTWWSWLQCLNMGGPERIGTVDAAVDCAEMSGIDWVTSGIRDCVMDRGDKSEGTQLLKESMERARLNEITRSCTIKVSGNTRCIRDGGRWYDCEGGSSPKEIAATIRKEWARLNPNV